MEGLEGLQRGHEPPLEPPITLTPAGAYVDMGAYEIPLRFLVRLAAVISGARCQGREKTIFVPLHFMNESDFKRDFLSKFIAGFTCQGCKRSSPEITYDGRKAVIKCTICGHVKIK